jgi:hypothetical protein
MEHHCPDGIFLTILETIGYVTNWEGNSLKVTYLDKVPSFLYQQPLGFLIYRP